MSEYGPRPEDIGPKDKEPTKPQGPTSEFKTSGKPPWKGGIPHNESKPQGPAPWKKYAKPPPFPSRQMASETPEQAQARLEKGNKALEDAKKAFVELNNQAEILMAEIESLKKRKLLASSQQVERLKAKVEDLVGTKSGTKYKVLVNAVERDSAILNSENRGDFTKLIEKIKTKYRSLRKEMEADLEEIEKGSVINKLARWFKRDS